MLALELIQATLVPIILISAAGLILISVQNRYGRIHDRIRDLLSEKRSNKNLSGDTVVKRHKNIDIQIGFLFRRAHLLKWSMILLYFSILLYIVTSLLIFSNAIINITLIEELILSIFASGLIILVIGAILIVVEISRSLSYLQLEIKMDSLNN